MAKGAHEAHELRHHDERAGRRLGHPEAVQHLAGPEPAIGTDRLLGNIGEHGIGAAKGDDRHLAEEQGDVAEHIAAAERDQEEGDRSQPEHQKDGGNLERPSRGRSRMGRCVLAERRIGIGDLLVADLLVATTSKKDGQTSAPTDEPDDPRDQDDQRKWRVEKEDRDEGRRRDPKQDVVVECAFADPNDRLQHDRQHGRLEAEEHGLHHADVAEGRIDPTQNHEGDEAWKNEERPGDESAPGLVQQPSNVDCKLLQPPARAGACSSSAREETGCRRSSASARPGFGASPRSAPPGRQSSAPRP